MRLEAWLTQTATHAEKIHSTQVQPVVSSWALLGTLKLETWGLEWPRRKAMITLALPNNSLLWKLWASVTWVILIQVQNLTYLSLEIDVRSLKNKFLHTVYVTSVGRDHEECGTMLVGGETEEQLGHRMSERRPGEEAAEMSGPLRACPSTKFPSVIKVSYE